MAGLCNSIERIRILDVGTGQGLFPILAREQFGCVPYATEMNKEEADFLNNSKGVKCWFGDLTDLGLPAGFFDIVTMWHVLEHTLNPLETLSEILRILRPGGLCVIAVPNVSSLENLLRLRLGFPLFSPAFHEWHLFHFSCETLSKIIDRTGFKCIRVMPDLHLPPRSYPRMRKLTIRNLSLMLHTLVPLSRKSAIIGVASKD